MVPPSPFSSGTAGPGPVRLSDMFCRTRRLDYNEKLEDGFRDAGGRSLDAPCPPGSPLPLSALVVVSRKEDEVLAQFLDRAAKKILRANDPVTRLMVAALLVSEVLGREVWLTRGQCAAAV